MYFVGPASTMQCGAEPDEPQMFRISPYATHVVCVDPVRFVSRGSFYCMIDAGNVVRCSNAVLFACLCFDLISVLTTEVTMAKDESNGAIRRLTSFEACWYLRGLAGKLS